MKNAKRCSVMMLALVMLLSVLPFPAYAGMQDESRLISVNTPITDRLETDGTLERDCKPSK